ncbi:ParB/RepB/Spo0J family partition protein [Clostridium beijerinckii]|uniref:ParB/RepB/Spo0J family partition protein n=1 Tax=Clostridium beijerinckii TaxID=1520 RepID=A0AAW3W9E7_CLOBE|nr:ParB/RepB/Spo0J family partition protein [Clostridium beijerinckii]MBC2456160.1 ParB/RepB/Spo0J family partition protein [Clostridium beijerinckii]MBC2475445.1 ParB/RepB/Spo0J family partition protein [Clostridium beijerinckii]NOV63446.1 ParB family chromosome partitioning protein [Clostridium beijerinckii]NOV69588.1 ParB family chromosome partitioning protein [Clostridium beijerinckii]NOW31503.1 ParB family chromosome partitioning protein [Clostridium beijerinckii]
MSYLKGIADRINGVDNKGFTQELDINSLVPSQRNFYGIREIEELAESIKENGLMHNLVVRKISNSPTKYEILSGERRYRAAKSLGYEKLPCQVKEISDLDAELILIQANAEQRELTPTEKMEGIKRLEAIYKQKRNNGEKLQGKTRDLIGKDLGLSGVQVGRYKKVDKDLIPDLKEKLDKEEITLTQAHTLSSLSESEQKVIHEEIKDLNAKESKEEIEVLVQGIKQPVESKLDKDLLQEMYPTASKEVKEEDIICKFQRALKEFEHPRLIISNDYIKGMFYIKQCSISKDNILSISIEDYKESYLAIQVKCFDKVDKISIEIDFGKPINPKILYKISDGVYIWFKRKIGLFSQNN